MARQTTQTTAQEIVAGLVENARDYHARRVTYAEFDARQRSLWDRPAKSDLLDRAVRSLLRDVQWA